MTDMNPFNLLNDLISYLLLFMDEYAQNYEISQFNLRSMCQLTAILIRKTARQYTMAGACGRGNCSPRGSKEAKRDIGKNLGNNSPSRSMSLMT